MNWWTTMVIQWSCNKHGLYQHFSLNHGENWAGKQENWDLIYPGWSGWWLTYPSEKWWSSSLGRMNFPTEWKHKHVPNHQPVSYYDILWPCYMWNIPHFYMAQGSISSRCKHQEPPQFHGAKSTNVLGYSFWCSSFWRVFWDITR